MRTLEGIQKVAIENGVPEGFVKVESDRSTLVIPDYQEYHFICLEVSQEELQNYYENFPEDNFYNGVFEGKTAILVFSTKDMVVLEVEGKIKMDESFRRIKFLEQVETVKVSFLVILIFWAIRLLAVFLLFAGFLFLAPPFNVIAIAIAFAIAFVTS